MLCTRRGVVAGGKAELNQFLLAISTDLPGPLAKEKLCQCLVMGWRGAGVSRDLRKPRLSVVSTSVVAEPRGRGWLWLREAPPTPNGGITLMCTEGIADSQCFDFCNVPLAGEGSLKAPPQTFQVIEYRKEQTFCTKARRQKCSLVIPAQLSAAGIPPTLLS